MGTSNAYAGAGGGTPLTVHGGGFQEASEALGLLLCRVGGVPRTF